MSERRILGWLVVLVVPLLAMGCMPANDASGYKTERVFNKETGQYFDVNVPYRTTVDPDGNIVKEEPSPQQVEDAVDKARWNAELKSSLDNYVHPQASSGTTGGRTADPGTSFPSSRPIPFDETTSAGSSFHEAGSPFDTPSSPSFP